MSATKNNLKYKMANCLSFLLLATLLCRPAFCSESNDVAKSADLEKFKAPLHLTAGDEETMTFWKKGLVGVCGGKLVGGVWMLPILIFVVTTALIMVMGIYITTVLETMLNKISSSGPFGIHQLSSMLMGGGSRNPLHELGIFLFVGSGWFIIYWGLANARLWLFWVLLVLYLLVFCYISSVFANPYFCRSLLYSFKSFWKSLFGVK